MVLDELATADTALQTCVDAQVWGLPEPDLVAALDAVHVLEQRLTALTLALVREVDGRGTAVTAGATSTAVWLRDRLRLTVPAARRLVALAAAMYAGPAPVRDELAAGAVTAEQARIITGTVCTVQAEAGAEAADKALHLLIDWASQFEPILLRRLAGRILDQSHLMSQTRPSGGRWPMRRSAPTGIDTSIFPRAQTGRPDSPGGSTQRPPPSCMPPSTR